MPALHLPRFVVITLTAFHIAHHALAFAPCKIQRRQIRILSYHLIVVSDGFSILAQLLIKHRPVVDRLVIVGFHTDNGREIFYSLIHILHLHPQKTSVEPCHHIFRIQSYRIVEISHRPEIILQIIFKIRPVYKQPRLLR